MEHEFELVMVVSKERKHGISNNTHSSMKTAKLQQSFNITVFPSKTLKEIDNTPI